MPSDCKTREEQSSLFLFEPKSESKAKIKQIREDKIREDKIREDK